MDGSSRVRQGRERRGSEDREEIVRQDSDRVLGGRNQFYSGHFVLGPMKRAATPLSPFSSHRPSAPPSGIWSFSSRCFTIMHNDIYNDWNNLAVGQFHTNRKGWGYWLESVSRRLLPASEIPIQPTHLPLRPEETHMHIITILLYHFLLR